MLGEAVLDKKEAEYELRRGLVSRVRRGAFLWAGTDGADMSGERKPSDLLEYMLENDAHVNIDGLRSPLLPAEIYREAHKGLPIACHDVAIECDGGILLVKRSIHPAKGIFWPVGGRITRGMSTEDSLRDKVKRECNLDLEDLSIIGYARTFFNTAPFDHGKGTDTINVVYFARGKGMLRLNHEHSSAKIIRPGNTVADEHPYVADILKKSLRRVSSLGAVMHEYRPVDHEDERRALITPFNGDFVSAQNKIVVMKQNRLLGGHYHADYRELHFVLKGKAVFTLVDPKTNEKRDYELGEHWRLIIPPRIPHKAAVEAGTILVSSTEKPYVSAKENDHPYDIL